MNTAQLHEAMELLFRAHLGRTWPGSSIPLLAHPLEVACRVAAWGGSDDEILSALLHDLPECLGLEAASAALCPLGTSVQRLLSEAWLSPGLPPAGSFPTPTHLHMHQDLRRLLACDALGHVRSLALDWDALASCWEEKRKIDHYRVKVADIHFKREPGPPYRRKQAAILYRRQPRTRLIAAYRQWMACPWPATPPPFEAFSLAGPACAITSDLATWCEAITSWNFPTLGKEMRRWTDQLSSLVDEAKEGFLVAHALNPQTYHAEVMDACLRHMSSSELATVLSCPHSGPFRAHVLQTKQASSPLHTAPSEGRLHRVDLHRPLLKALNTCLMQKELVLPALPQQPISSPSADAHFTSRILDAIHSVIEIYAHDHWPLSRIPLLLHGLEAMSLALLEGCDEATALWALRNPLQEHTEGSRGTEALDTVALDDPMITRGIASACALISHHRFLTADCASLSPEQGGDPHGVRHELHALLPTFQAMFLERSECQIVWELVLQGRPLSFWDDDDNDEPWSRLLREDELMGPDLR